MKSQVPDGDLFDSKMCFGCEALGGTDWGAVDVPEIARAIGRALELGVNFFDTAAVYGLGLSEQRLADILGGKRHDLLIATKGGLSWDELQPNGRACIRRDSSKVNLRQGVEDSLRRLRLERIPLYYIHWPDPETDIRATFECLMELREEGKILHIGCSNFEASQVRAACEVAKVSFAQLPLNILGEGPTAEMQATLDSHGVGIVAYNVLASGLLTGKYNAQSKFPADDRRSRLPAFQGDLYQQALAQVAEMQPLAVKAGLSVAQYSITWALDHPAVVATILGIKSIGQLEENWAAFCRRRS
jgi:aryl-alcohol dehydrogenase-like predicted oxidoreductase